MRKIILSMNITEDGFIAGPDGELDWHFPFWNFEMCESLCRVLYRADTILLGRKTYNTFAQYWASQGAGIAIATEDLALMDMMNRYTKIVVSQTLSTFSWKNSFLIQGDILSGMNQLKLTSGKDIIIFGSSKLTAYLLKYDLIDEYYFWVHPIMIRQGKRLSRLNHNKFKVKPVQVEHFSSGVIKLYFSGRC